MTINAINSLFSSAYNPATAWVKKPEPSFIHWIETQLEHTNHQLNKTDKALLQLASGHGEPLHHTMLVLEEAKLSLHYLQQIRNRLIGAYQELLREQI